MSPDKTEHEVIVAIILMRSGWFRGMTPVQRNASIRALCEENRLSISEFQRLSVKALEESTS